MTALLLSILAWEIVQFELHVVLVVVVNAGVSSMTTPRAPVPDPVPPVRTTLPPLVLPEPAAPPRTVRLYPAPLEALATSIVLLAPLTNWRLPVIPTSPLTSSV